MPENLNDILAQQLKDPHLPDAVGWWPPAIGWWVLAGMVICGLAALVLILIRRRRINRYRKLAVLELQDCLHNWHQNQDSGAYLQSANTILKRAVLSFEKCSKPASLSGQQWVEVLNEYASRKLSSTTRSALAIGCYQPEPDADISEIHRDLEAWLKTHGHSRQATQEVDYA
ncbi:MAG: DUF4381 domain-containing protein [Gammaproteobacteria bacterium]|nr:DUF4381 domain-containing protein [Gammaproteobacteria bacterium]